MRELNPIYFFTSLNYENYIEYEPMESDEESWDLYYFYTNIKNEEKDFGIAFHCSSYPTFIPAVKYALNVDELGEGDYAIDSTISYEDCLACYYAFIDQGIPQEDITVEMVKHELKKTSKKL